MLVCHRAAAQGNVSARACPCACVCSRWSWVRHTLHARTKPRPSFEQPPPLAFLPHSPRVAPRLARAAPCVPAHQSTADEHSYLTPVGSSPRDRARAVSGDSNDPAADEASTCGDRQHRAHSGSSTSAAPCVAPGSPAKAAPVEPAAADGAPAPRRDAPAAGGSTVSGSVGSGCRPEHTQHRQLLVAPAGPSSAVEAAPPSAATSDEVPPKQEGVDVDMDHGNDEDTAWCA
jgi:hypothetical protein